MQRYEFFNRPSPRKVRIMFKKTTVIYILFLSGNSFMQSRRGKHDGLTSRSAARIVSAEPPDRADSDRAEISPAPKSAGMFCTRHTHFAEDRFPLRQAVPRQNQINLVLRSACTLCGDKPRLDRRRLGKSQINLVLPSACTIFVGELKR